VVDVRDDAKISDARRVGHGGGKLKNQSKQKTTWGRAL